MIILITILIIAAIVAAWIFNDNCKEGWCFTCVVGAALFGTVDLILIIIAIFTGFNSITIDDKISMYNEENIKIEEQMTTIVQSYKGYEERIIKNVADMEVAFIRFPELKASEMVQKQMNVYIENNNKIKKLKETKIETKIFKWLLYFGG